MKKQSIHRNCIFITAAIIILNSVSALQAQKKSGKTVEGSNVTEVRLMNMSNIFTAYGMPGHFVRGHSLISEIDISIGMQVGKIEKGISIDTPEEFITAAYFSPIQITPKAQAAIDRELPKNKEGALRLTSMWLKKRADLEISPASYQKALDIIKTRSGVSDSVIMAHYQSSIRKEIIRLGKIHLSKQYTNHEIENGLLMPVYNYYLNPITSNIAPIVNQVNKAKSPAAYMLVIGLLSPRLSDEVNRRL